MASVTPSIVVARAVSLKPSSGRAFRYGLANIEQLAVVVFAGDRPNEAHTTEYAETWWLALTDKLKHDRNESR